MRKLDAFCPILPEKSPSKQWQGALSQAAKFQGKMWAKQDHITKISINMSPSKDFSLKRSDWAARSFCPRAFLFTGSQSHPSFLHFTVTCSPPLHPLLSHSLYIHQSATLNCSPWTPLSLTSLCSPALPFSTPSYFSPEHSSSVSTALPFRPFVSPPPNHFDNHYTKLMRYQSPRCPRRDSA